MPSGSGDGWRYLGEPKRRSVEERCHVVGFVAGGLLGSREWLEHAVELLGGADVESAPALVDDHGASGLTYSILSMPEDCDDHGRVVDVDELSIGFWLFHVKWVFLVG